MLNFLKYFTNRLGKKMVTISNNEVSELGYIERKISTWKSSPLRESQIKGEMYYKGIHDIVKRKRQVIGENGALTEVNNLPNHRIIDNQYSKMVDQKKNYLLGQPIVFNTENEKYNDILTTIFDKKFMKTIKDLGGNSITGGLAWVHPYYDEEGNFKFKTFPAYEILPFWANKEHTKLNFAVRYYLEERRNGKTEDYIEKVELYTPNGIFYYDLVNGKLKENEEMPHRDYLTLESEEKEIGYNWDRIPLIPFKYNNFEMPLLNRCKSIQDAINIIMSDFVNGMEENAGGNSILVLENYDGEKLDKFRQLLSQYRAVKVRSTDGSKGDVRKLEIEVNAANYELVLRELKRELVENCRGFDAKDDRMSNNPNQMNIKSALLDLSMDSREMQSEYEASFDSLLWFVNKHILNSGLGNYENENVEIIFNIETIINDTELMQTLISAGVRISNKTLLKQVSFIDSIDDEIKQLEEEENKQLDVYGGAFPNNNKIGDADDNEE